MSADYVTFRETDRPSLVHRLAAYIAAHPKVTTVDLYAAFPMERRCSVKRVVSELKKRGFLQADRIVGAAGQGSNRVSWWYPTATLLRQLSAGEKITVGQRVATPLEEDEWTPQPWIHPIRARAHRLQGAAAG